MVKGSVVANSPLLFVLVAVGLLIVIAYAVLSVVKASQRCKELGVSSETISNVVKATATSSVVPSLAILLGFLTLTVSLGVIWPWWRLSVIGSLSYEAMASNYTVDALGAAMSEILNTDANVFGAVMMVMSFGIITGPIVAVLFAKKYSTGIMRAKVGQSEWGQVMSGCFFLAMFSVYIPILLFTDLPTTLTMAVSFVVTLICGVIGKKAKWLNNFTMAIAMLVAMASSVLWVGLFK